jgi:3-hydroxyacyl-CoA dehydrogenase
MGKTEQTTKITIGVVAAGTMASGIALAALAAGLTVTLYDIAPEMMERGRGYIQKHLARKGKEAAGVLNLINNERRLTYGIFRLSIHSF